MIFRNALAIDEIGQRLLEERWTIGPDGLASISSYLAEGINRGPWPGRLTVGLRACRAVRHRAPVVSGPGIGFVIFGGGSRGGGGRR
ncbi:hypothetical protein [Streptomyces sp. NPDC008092]|uniref:hypothetical protein n=1 Tax=Streptomyces sp. NPDC008092 TaxID=3364808 RepID=UPI0036E06FAE